MQVTYQYSEIKNIAALLWNEGSVYKVWAFHGEMGSGKTTLIYALCNMLKTEDAISSPTFAIINEYTSAVAGTIFHMDWYRMKSETEAIQAGCEDCIESGNFCFVEWPEKAISLLPEICFHIFIETVNATERKLTTETTAA